MSGGKSSSHHAHSRGRSPEEVRKGGHAGDGAAGGGASPDGKASLSKNQGSSKGTSGGVVARTSNETTYLHQKLRDVLSRQVITDEQHQQNLLIARHQLRQLCDENASLRNIISAAEFRKRNEGRVSSPDDPPSVTEAEVQILSNRINLARRSANRVRHELGRLQEVTQAEEKKEREALRVLSATKGVIDHAAMDAAITGNSSIALRIQKIEHQLNEVLGKQRVVLMVTDGYRKQIEELQKEKFDYDNQLLSLEQQYADRHREHLNLITLFQNAQYDYEKMVSQRVAFSQHAKKQRRLKEKLLVDRRAEVQQAILESERHHRSLVDLQMMLDEESQLLEEVEAMHQELLNRAARQRNVDSLLATGGLGGSGGGGGKGRLGSTSGSGQDAELEEQLTAYHLAIQELLKEAKAENRQQLVPVFRSEITQYEQLRAQVDTKRARQEQLEAEVKRLREAYANAKVCAATAGPIASHSSGILEEELLTFLAESERELAQLVQDEESRRLLLRDLTAQGNRLSQLLSLYRPEIPIRPLRETDPQLPIHFTALTQKVLSLADEATAGVGAEGIAPPPSGVPLMIPMNNVRVSLRSGGTRDAAESSKYQGGASKKGKKKKIASVASPGAAAALQLRKGGRGRSISSESSLLDLSLQLTQDADHATTQPFVVDSDLDEDGGSSGSSSSSGSDDDHNNNNNNGYRAGGGAQQRPPHPNNMNTSGMSFNSASTSLRKKGNTLPPRAPPGAGSRRPASASALARSGGAGPVATYHYRFSGRDAQQTRGGGTQTNKSGRGSSVVSDGPLEREELKHVSMAIKEREKKRLLNEERRRASLAKDM